MKNSIKENVFDLKEYNSFSYKIVSVMLIIFGILFFYLSISLYLEPIEKIDWERIKTDSFRVCEETAVAKGYKVIKDYPAGRIEMRNIDLNNPVALAAEAESIMLRCQNFELRTFCMGDRQDCEIFGIKQTLQYKQPSKVKSKFK